MNDNLNQQSNQVVERKVVRGDRRKKFSRNKKSLIIIGVTSMVLIIATYAWFVGVARVQVDPFEVEVVTTEGLSMSIDGKNWGNTIKITRKTIIGDEKIFVDERDTGDVLVGTNGTYPVSAGNVDHWSSAGNDTGLEPVSAPGRVFYDSNNTSDTRNSQAVFYAKTTMTTDNTGYKLTAGEITGPSARGYIAFDLFLKNATNNSYDATYNAQNDEEIFLTKESSVVYDANGADAGQGIENSIRLGFYSLGRVDARTDFSTTAGLRKIQGISCAPATGITNLCNIAPDGTASNSPVRGYNWNIWEPNDRKHKEAAIYRFNGSCLRRDSNGKYYGETGYAGVNSQTCSALYVNPTTFDGYVDTYTVNDEILLSAAVDSNIYDCYNDYINNKMYDVDTLTDTENRNEATRHSLLHIAPSSITKIRVYIYIEGQDIDNYDIAAAYKSLKVKFGFTKERFDDTNLPNNQATPNPFVYSISTHSINGPITVTTYQDFNSAKTAFGHPAAIAHSLDESTIKESYVVFERNGNVYYLKGGVNESGLVNKPTYDYNVFVLKDAFGPDWQSVCTDNTSYFQCMADDINANANSTGNVSASKSTWFCSIENGSSICSG